MTIEWRPTLIGGWATHVGERFMAAIAQKGDVYEWAMGTFPQKLEGGTEPTFLRAKAAAEAALAKHRGLNEPPGP